MRRLAFVGVCSLGYLTALIAAQEVPPRPTRPAAPADDAIDFNRARELLRRSQSGQRLSAEEQAYLNRALEARRKQEQGQGPRGGGPSRAIYNKDQLGFKPLTEMSAEDRYEGLDGGLYGAGRNEPPETHRVTAERELARIQPLDAQGKPAARGLVGFVSLSMSNATQEFSTFKRIADRDPEKSDRLAIVDCAQGGQTMVRWADPEAAPWREAERRLQAAGVAPAQVQVAWVKLANAGPRGSLEDHLRPLVDDTRAVLQNAKQRFPNLRIAYLSSRIYGGYASGQLNPEPYAYEGAFGVRRLIQDQIAGAKELNFDPAEGAVKTPLLLWGPYLWADGVRPRAADQLVYLREDLAEDGTHPTHAGQRKVAGLLLNFFRDDPLARPWFTQARGR